MTEITKEIQDVLSEDPGSIPFEQMVGEGSSPLNQPVVEKDIAGNRPDEEESTGNSAQTPDTGKIPTPEPEEVEPDAPEQQIDDTYEEIEGEEAGGVKEEVFELPDSYARDAADAFLGMADNFLEVGGGFFVKIKKHGDFYDFEEIIQVIDEHNERNVKRLKLEKEDKALLRPLLMAVLKKKAKKLTPEQQLMGAVISILVKKAQVVMEIRAENELLTERILEIIRQERREVPDAGTPEPEAEVVEEEPEEVEAPEATIEYEEAEEAPPVIDPASVLEVAEGSDEHNNKEE